MIELINIIIADGWGESWEEGEEEPQNRKD